MALYNFLLGALTISVSLCKKKSPEASIKMWLDIEGHSPLPPAHYSWNMTVNFSLHPILSSPHHTAFWSGKFPSNSDSIKGNGGDRPSQGVDFDPSCQRVGRLVKRPVFIYIHSPPSGTTSTTNKNKVQVLFSWRKAVGTRHDWVHCLFVWDVKFCM
jgi:hypothetical protein